MLYLGWQDTQAQLSKMLMRGHYPVSEFMPFFRENHASVAPIPRFASLALCQSCFFQLIYHACHITLVTDQQVGEFAEGAPLFVLKMHKCPELGNGESKPLHELPVAIVKMNKRPGNKPGYFLFDLWCLDKLHMVSH